MSCSGGARGRIKTLLNNSIVARNTASGSPSDLEFGSGGPAAQMIVQCSALGKIATKHRVECLKMPKNVQ